jgi:hypothetical protein
MKRSIRAVLFLAICPLLMAQQVLNNEAVVKLVKAGLADDLIISTIIGSPGTYDISADGIIALKGAGVSDKVVTAILRKAAIPAAVSAPVPAPPAAVVGTTAVVHIYRYKQFEAPKVRPSVYCDGTLLGRITRGHFLDVKIPPGSHVFLSEDKQAGAAVTLEPGKEYFFRIDMQMGVWKGSFRLTMVIPEQGKYEVSKLKPLDSRDALHQLPAGTDPQ